MPIDPDRFERVRTALCDDRPRERVEAHLNCELALARRLLSSSREERRKGLYTQVYGELFASLPDHPQHKKSERSARADLDRQVALIDVFAAGRRRVLEIGAGDGALSVRLAAQGRTCIAVDVSDGVADADALEKAGVRFEVTDGLSFPVETASVDFAYSNQLIEHLHPDDAAEQLREVRRCLAPGGVYYVVTPHAFTGPHDVSLYVGDIPKGLHLREYTYATLARLARQAGFSRVRFALCRGGRVIAVVPSGVAIALEQVFAMGRTVGWPLRSSRAARFALGIHAVFVV